MRALGELLGESDLILGAELAPLDAGLDKALRDVIRKTAEMQAVLDRLHFPDIAGGLVSQFAAVDAAVATTEANIISASEAEAAAIKRVTDAYLAQAAAARLAGEAADSAAARSGGSVILPGHAAESHPGLAATMLGIEGVRGKAHPGSRQNPMVVVLEAGRYTSLGGMAAAIGDNSAASPAFGAPPPAIAGNAPPTAAATNQGERESKVLAGQSSTDKRNQLAQEAALAAAIDSLAKATAPKPQPGGSHATPVIITDTSQKAAKAQSDAISQAATDAIMAKLAGKNLGPGEYAAGKAGYAAAYEALGYRAAMAPDQKLRLYGIGGEPGTSNFGLAPGAAAAGGGFLGGRAGGGGGGGFPPWLAALLWGHPGGGGGGGGRGFGPLGAAVGGALGIGAGVGSIGSFAGFGAEHLLLTGGGIVGSGLAAVAGGGLLAAGAAGKIGVGGGSDLAVLKSTITQTKELQSSYDALQKAIAVYGKNSEQAKVAQKEFNFTVEELGNTAGTKAELALAKAGEKMTEFWDHQTSGARVQATKILSQFLQLAHAYIPLVAHAAEQNLGIIDKTLKPLMTWLKGPEAMGIFVQLEQEFRSQIPTAMHLLDQAVQFFAKTIAYTAPLTGKFLHELDHFFTKWNSPTQFAVWSGEINKLVNDFHVWSAFVKILGKDLFDLFNKDAHTGQGIIETLTVMLKRLNEWENSTKGSAAIRNIFLVHKEEVIALLKLLPLLVSAFAPIYMTVAPPLVKAVTTIATVFAKLLETIENAGPLGTWAIGLTLIAAKLKVLGPLLSALKAELLGVASAESEAAVGADALAAGETAAGAGAGVELAGGGGVLLRGAGGLSAAERANAATNATGGEAGLLGGLLGRGKQGLKALDTGTLLRGGAAGAVGLIGGSLAAGAVGAHGTLGTAISGAGAGAGAGFVLGPAAGALLGTEITPVLGTALGAGIGAAAPYVIKGLKDLFSSGTEQAVAHARHETSGYLGLDQGLLGPARGQLQNKPFERAAIAARRAEAAARSTTPIFNARGGVEQLPSAGHVSQAAVEAAQRRLGEVAGKAYVEGFQHVRFPSRLGFLVSMEQHLEALPPKARGAAAKTMLQYAAQLEATGQLPKGVVAGFIAALEHKFSGLTSYLNEHGSATSAAIAKAYNLQHAKETVSKGLTQIEQQFGVHFAHTEAGTTEAMKFLQEIIRNNKGPLADAAREMLSVLSPAFQLEWQRAQEANAEGIRKINSEISSELKKIGAGAEVVAGLKHGTGKGGGVNLHGTPFEGSTLGGAVGGLIQIGRAGEAGHDTVGLNVGGMPIAVAPGEQVAVFNRHQLPIVNAALAGVGGLEGLFGAVSTPHYMASGGLIPQVAQAALKDERGAASKLMGQLRGAAAARAGGGRGGAGVGGHAAGTAQMRAWAKAGLQAAGLPGTPGEVSLIVYTMSHESGGNPRSENTTDSNARAGHPSRGLMELIPENFATYHVPGTSNDVFDPVANVAAAVRYMIARYGHIVGMSPYAQGGLLSFAGGGLVPSFAGGGAVHPPKRAKPIKSWQVHPFGRIPKLATSWWGEGFYHQLGSIMGETGTVARDQETYELANKAAELALRKAPHEGQFIITPNAGIGETGGPYVDWANVEMRRGQLHHLEGLEGDELGALNQAWELSTKVLASFAGAIEERRKAIAAIQKKIRENLAAIKVCQERIHRFEVALKKAKHGSPEAKHLEQQIRSEHGKIAQLHAENKRLGGAEEEVGTGGNIGVLQAQIGELRQGKETTQGYAHTIAGVTGHGGERQQVLDTLAELGQQTLELGGEALHTKLLEQGGGGESALELAERQKAQAEEKAKIEHEGKVIAEQALQVFGGPGDIGSGGANAFAAAAAKGGMFIPYGGSFDVGGIVPGRLGEPVAALLHGGEEVLRPDQRGGGNLYQYFDIKTLMPGDPRTLHAVGSAATRGQRLQGYRLNKRIFPGV